VSAVFVGRQGVIERLEAKLGDAYAGRASVVMLAGEPGIGKTAIAREFASLARERGATVLSGCCFEGGWQPALLIVGAYVRIRLLARNRPSR
jgi:predicted ATPase